MDSSQDPALKPGEFESETGKAGRPVFAQGSEHIQEREALARILASGEFQRSPNLESILIYLCNQYFSGTSHLVKEYLVATEACNRGEDFDPKKDAIVRVEMHRLRKRLREYYESRGALEPVRISFPTKSYVPEFETVFGAAAEASEAAAGVEPRMDAEPDVVGGETGAESPPPKKRRAVPAWVLAIAGVCGIGLLLPRFLPSTESEPGGVSARQEQKGSLPEAPAPELVPAPVSGGEIRILAGRPKGRYPDRYGVVWQGDEYFHGGKAVAIEAEVRSRGFDSNLFSGKREGDFQYDIPLPPGPYELLLLFAETSFGEGNAIGAGTLRTFHITINGTVALENLDVTADATDLNAATAKLLKDLRPAKDGKLHLRFDSSLTGKAFVNAFVVRPGVTGKMKPIRIVCRPHAYTDSYNNVWEPDRYFRGGVQITRPTGAALAKDPDLVKGERYGKFSYTIPVPPGKYQARLFFWEYWFGPEGPGKGGPGSRIFDVFCNFRPLLSGLDIIQRNPKEKYIVQVVHGLTPNLDSKLIFEFSPKANNALLNAIEIAEDDATLEAH